jgi:hypothetical protein
MIDIRRHGILDSVEAGLECQWKMDMIEKVARAVGQGLARECCMDCDPGLPILEQYKTTSFPRDF